MKPLHKDIAKFLSCSTLSMFSTVGGLFTGDPTLLAAMAAGGLALSEQVFSGLAFRGVEGILDKRKGNFIIENQSELPIDNLLPILKDSLKSALKELLKDYNDSYKKSEITDGLQHHFNDLSNHINVLCKLLDEGFVAHCENILASQTSSEIKSNRKIDGQLVGFLNGEVDATEELALKFLRLSELDNKGPYFKPYFQEHFRIKFFKHFEQKLRRNPEAHNIYTQVHNRNSFKILNSIQSKLESLELTVKGGFDSTQDEIISLRNEVFILRDKILDDSTAKTKNLTIDALRSNISERIKKQLGNKEEHFQKKYISSVYRERNEAKELFDKFLIQDEKKCFVITGKAGRGKTTFFCHLTEKIKGDQSNIIPLLVNCPELRLYNQSIEEVIVNGLNTNETNAPLNQIGDLLLLKNYKLVVFLDAINELEGDQIFDLFNDQLDQLFQEINLNMYPIYFCISCRSDFWQFFNTERLGDRTFLPDDGLPGQSTVELDLFPEEEMGKIIQKHLEWYNILGRIEGQARDQCRDPLMLRYFCEAYTFRQSNDRSDVITFSEKKIGVRRTLQRKEIFDLFVKNIRDRMDRRIKKLDNIDGSDDILSYTTNYIINIARLMYKNRRAFITIDEAKGVAQELNHPDGQLSEKEFKSEKSIFYMFIDEGLVLDRHQRGKYYFIFESYYEYTLGRYIALERWKDWAVNGNKEEISADLVKLLEEHTEAAKKNSYTNILGAIQYAILTTEDNEFYSGEIKWFAELIHTMMTHKNTELVQQQQALSILRTTYLLSGQADKFSESEVRNRIGAVLSNMKKFVVKCEDFVILLDIEQTLEKLAEVDSAAVILEMKKWTEANDKQGLLKFFASQVIARVSNVELDRTLELIHELSHRSDFKSSFWLTRSLLFGISEVIRESDLSAGQLDQLWGILYGIMNDDSAPMYSRDLAFSTAIFLPSYNTHSKLIDLAKSDKITVWGLWNSLYDIKERADQSWITESSWVWELINISIEKKDHQLDYILQLILVKLSDLGFEDKIEAIQDQLRYPKWSRNEISGDVLSDEIRPTGIVYSPIYLEPSYDNHLECRQRLQAILSTLYRVGESNYTWVNPKDASDNQLKMVHGPKHKNDRHRNGAVWESYYKEVVRAGKLFSEGKIKRRHTAGPAELRYESVEVARISTGGVVRAVDYVMEKTHPSKAAWSLGRPPGHLANNAICIFNNVAVGAKYALDKYRDRVEKILIIDCDAHHGKHTDWVFRNDDKVIYFSIHVDTSYTKESGGLDAEGIDDEQLGNGKGYTFNVPYPRNTDDRGYAYICEKLLEPMAMEFKPDLIMVSAGFDGHFEDELNPGNQFTERAFIKLAEVIRKVAKELDIKVVGCFEGGYGLDSLAYSFVHMMNVIGDWGVDPDRIGFVPQDQPYQNDKTFDMVKDNVRERVGLMQKRKKENPEYQLFNNEETWAEFIN